MAWSAPMTAVPNTVFTASQYNRFIRDNLMETAVAKATEAGQYFVVDGINSIAARKPAAAFVFAGETTTSSTYGDLSTPGPTVTLETGERAFVMLSAGLEPVSTNNVAGAMSVQISGASNIAASDSNSVSLDGITAGTGNIRMGITHLIDNLTPGTNVFQCKYRAVNSSNFRFWRRTIVVFPF